jgi:beta-glucosidase
MCSNKQAVLTAFIIIISAFVLNAQKKYPYQDPKLSMGKRIDNIISLLTLEEKISFIASNESGIPRLNIPSPGFA